MSETVELCLDAHANLGEGALWDEKQQVLYWVDIMGGILHVYNPGSDHNASYPIGQPVGTVVLDRQGGVLLAVRDGFARYDLESAQLTLIHDPESHLPNNRFNDGKCDPGGRFWAGTMAMVTHQQGAGSLYRFDPDGSVNSMRSSVTISNGLVWSTDERIMYYIDTIPHTVTAFDYDKQKGSISNERVVITVPEQMGSPDGMAIDVEDKLWIAHYGGSCVRRWDPLTGQVMKTIDLPTSNITSCAFGGPELDTLYITSQGGQDPEKVAREPQAGGLFRVKIGVKGRLSYRFAG